MRSLLFVALLALIGAALTSNVVELTPDNFDTVVDGSKHVFVEFFAPWYASSVVWLRSHDRDVAPSRRPPAPSSALQLTRCQGVATARVLRQRGRSLRTHTRRSPA